MADGPRRRRLSARLTHAGAAQTTTSADKDTAADAAHSKRQWRQGDAPDATLASRGPAVKREASNAGTVQCGPHTRPLPVPSQRSAWFTRAVMLTCCTTPGLAEVQAVPKRGRPAHTHASAVDDVKPAVLCSRTHALNVAHAAGGWASAAAQKLDLVWHGAAEGAHELARLASSFQAAQSATRLPDTFRTHLGAYHKVLGPCAKLRWYDAAVDRVWRAWLGPDGVDGTTPANGGSAWMFGTEGVGKSVWRNFMAVSILQRRYAARDAADRECLIVFDGGARITKKHTVLVRQRSVAGDAPLVEVAATYRHSVARRAAAVAGCRVYHLLGSQKGNVVGSLGAMYTRQRFTLLTSDPDIELETTLLWEARQVATVDVLAAPCSTREEMHTLNKLKPAEEQLSDDRVNYIVDRYGAVPLRLRTMCGCADEASERRVVEMWKSSVRRHEWHRCHLPSHAELERVFGDFVIRDPSPLDGAHRPAGDLVTPCAHRLRWASPFVLRLLSLALIQNRRFPNGIIGRYAPTDVRHQLAEDLLAARRSNS